MPLSFECRKRAGAGLVLALAALLYGCSPTPPGKVGTTTTAPGDNVRLQGTGATFPMPIYQKWVSEYGKLNPKVQIDYQSTG
ncbi:MAG TPA: hypothetical protein VE360_14105, partial [Pyrinomonadaceae bacterium]|nr:hypothetical protein [Pyrinomonadaceae bacterium]